MLLSRSPNYNDCISHNGQHATGHYDTKNQPEIDPAITRPTPINLFFHCGGYFATENGDGITAIFTAMLAVITVLLAFLAYDQGRTTRAQLRAYVVVSPKRAALDFDDHTVTVVAFTQNKGQTPAFKTQVLWDAKVMEYPMRVKLRYDGHPGDIDKPIPTFVCYPEADTITVKRITLTDSEIASIRGKTHALYAYGRVTYLDAFKDPQKAEFCACIDGEYFDIWMIEAKASQKRQHVPAPFKFTENNNTASF